MTSKSADSLYEDAISEGERLVDDVRFRGLKTERAARRIEKLLDKFEKAWNRKNKATATKPLRHV